MTSAHISGVPGLVGILLLLNLIQMNLVNNSWTCIWKICLWLSQILPRLHQAQSHNLWHNWTGLACLCRQNMEEPVTLYFKPVWPLLTSQVSNIWGFSSNLPSTEPVGTKTCLRWHPVVSDSVFDSRCIWPQVTSQVEQVPRWPHWKGQTCLIGIFHSQDWKERFVFVQISNCKHLPLKPWYKHQQL